MNSSCPDRNEDPRSPNSHRLRAKSLPFDEEIVFRELTDRVDLNGAVVLEVGGAMDSSLADRAGVLHWTAVDPRLDANEASENRTLLKQRFEEASLESESCDVVFSCNALQFVDFEALLTTAHRVLKPGGVFYAHFSPIWSGIDGHQMQYVDYEGRDLIFCETPIIPPFAHLVLREDEMREMLLTGVDGDLAEVAVEHTFNSTTVNRLSLRDYMNLIMRSEFEMIECVSSDWLDYPINTPKYDPSWLALVQERVQRLRATDRSVGARDLLILLRRPSADLSTSYTTSIHSDLPGVSS